MSKLIESRKSELRYVTSDPDKMLGKWVARRVLHTWTEEFVDSNTGETKTVERSEVLLERGTYIDQDTLCSIKFMMQEGSLKEVEVSNQNRQGFLFSSSVMYPYKAVVKNGDKRKTYLLYATSVANALLVLTDYVELNTTGGFTVTDIKEMDYCVILIDTLMDAAARRYEIDAAYLKGEMSLESFAEATCDCIAAGNPDSKDDESKKEAKKFYQIGAHVVLRNEEDGGESEEDHTFIVQTVSAVRANMLIEKYLNDMQEERYRESLKHPERTFVRLKINSFIEESKIIPIGCFIPRSFSEVYNETDEH